MNNEYRCFYLQVACKEQINSAGFSIDKTETMLKQINLASNFSSNTSKMNSLLPISH